MAREATHGEQPVSMVSGVAAACRPGRGREFICPTGPRFLPVAEGTPVSGQHRRMGSPCLAEGCGRDRVLVTAAGPHMGRVLDDLSLPSFARFAAERGYAVLAARLGHDGVGADAAAQDAKWLKLRLLRDALSRFPLAVWVDADVLILRDDEDVADHLHPDHFQAFALEQVPAENRVNPNTGVWVMRSCPAAFAFLNAVEALGPQPGPWADQGAVLVALGWDRGDATYRWARPGGGSPFLAGTSWLPPSWNQPFLGERRPGEDFNSDVSSYAGRPAVGNPHAVHFMGLTPEARYRVMAETVAAAGLDRASPTPAPEGWPVVAAG